jgi:hypothetical protein
MSGDITIYQKEKIDSAAAGEVISPETLPMIESYSFRIDFLMRQRISFCIDFYVRQRGRDVDFWA